MRKGRNPYWEAFRYPDYVLAQGALQPEVPYQYPAKVYSNPHDRGYGSVSWPFDYSRAIRLRGYREGVRRAIQASWTASNWKFAASKLLQQVDSMVVQLRRQANRSWPDHERAYQELIGVYAPGSVYTDCLQD